MNTITDVNRRFGTPKGASSSPDYDVVIVGAGPYGLSAGAYLKNKGLGVRVFGEPMDFWANKMPAGMLLRSPREASSIADPESAFTLDAYEKTSGISPIAPVPLETFVQYGRWFQHQLGSSLERTTVSSVDRDNSTFKVELQGGTTVRSRRVVVAAGVGPFKRIPPVFSDLSPDQVSHCYEGRKISDFVGKRVAVIGAGQSALESAALLHEGGADVEIIARIPQLRWIGRHPRLHQLGPVSKALYSKYDVGPAGISRLVATPNAVFPLPLAIKDRIRVRAVRSAGSKWLPNRLKSVKKTLASSITKARTLREELQLFLEDGTERRVDLVLLGTGYDVDIDRYEFLSSTLLADVRRLGGYPDLKAGFASSVPGLHFIGATAARSFGPLLYFVAGTEFASRTLTRSVYRSRVSVD